MARRQRLIGTTRPKQTGRKLVVSTSREMPVAKLKAAAYNPRIDLQPGDPEYEKLKRSIEQWGYVDPLVWNARTGNLVGGHQRLKVLVNEFGVKSVRVQVVDLPLDQERMLNVALNKVGGDWDKVKLAELLKEIEAEDLDVSMTGFDEAEIQRMYEDAAALTEAGQGGEIGDDQDGDAAPGDSEGGRESDSAAVQFTVGGFRFEVKRAVYDRWVEDMRQSVGFDEAAILGEIKRRLKLAAR